MDNQEFQVASQTEDNKVKEDGIKKAVEVLPEGCQEDFIELWKEAETMDNYQDLDTYIRVIHQELETRRKKIEWLEEKIIGIQEVIEDHKYVGDEDGSEE